MCQRRPQTFAEAINARHPGLATYVEIPLLDHHLSLEASQRAAFSDPTPPATRPYFGATLEPVLDAWLDEVSSGTIRGTAPE